MLPRKTFANSYIMNFKRVNLICMKRQITHISKIDTKFNHRGFGLNKILNLKIVFLNAYIVYGPNSIRVFNYNQRTFTIHTTFTILLSSLAYPANTLPNKTKFWWSVFISKLHTIIGNRLMFFVNFKIAAN